MGSVIGLKHRFPVAERGDVFRVGATRSGVRAEEQTGDLGAADAGLMLALEIT